MINTDRITVTLLRKNWTSQESRPSVTKQGRPLKGEECLQEFLSLEV